MTAPSYRRSIPEGSLNIMVPGSFRSHRVEGSINLKCSVALCLCLLAALLLAEPISPFRSEQPLDPSDWKLTDILERLERGGLSFHIVPTAKPGVPCESVFLTED